MEDTNNIQNETEFKAVPKKKAAKRKVNQIGENEEKMEVATDSVSEERPSFPPVKREKLSDGTEMRKIAVPAHRYSPLKENWMKIFTPIVEHLHLQIRFNLKSRQVEIRTCKNTEDIGNKKK